MEFVTPTMDEFVVMMRGCCKKTPGYQWLRNHGHESLKLSWGLGQSRPQGALPSTSKAREKRPGDELGVGMFSPSVSLGMKRNRNIRRIND